MRSLPAVLLLGVCCLATAGCLSHQVGKDGRNFRQALLDMYDDQTMDNLIRAATGQAYVQLEYRNLLVTDTQTLKANLADESDPSTSRSIARSTAKAIAATTTYVNKLSYGGTAQRDRQLQFQADPVTGKKDVYDYYIAFVRDPALFKITDCEPTCPVHVKKQRDGLWYWVPAEVGPVYQQLALRTTFMRGPEAPPPIYWDSRIVAITPRYSKNGKSINNKYVIALEREVPNDDGYAIVELGGGKTQRLALQRLVTQPFVEGLPDQQSVPVPKTLTSTVVLYADYDTTGGGPPIAQFTNRPAKVYAENTPNLGSKSPAQQILDDHLADYRRSLTQ